MVNRQGSEMLSQDSSTFGEAFTAATNASIRMSAIFCRLLIGRTLRESSVPFTGPFRPLRSPEPSSTSLRSHTRFRLKRCQLYTISVRCRLRRTFPGATLPAHHAHTQTSHPQCTPESRAFWLRPEEHWSRQNHDERI